MNHSCFFNIFICIYMFAYNAYAECLYSNRWSKIGLHFIFLKQLTFNFTGEQWWKYIKSSDPCLKSAPHSFFPLWSRIGSASMSVRWLRLVCLSQWEVRKPLLQWMTWQDNSSSSSASCLHGKLLCLFLRTLWFLIYCNVHSCLNLGTRNDLVIYCEPELTMSYH